ncbi:MAG: hypothetical protein LKF52_02080 [Butyrivibrio sp.]|jgi:hypothetical protein|nr:hypothetical protein [Butyrivibrio sp.]
MKYKNISAEDLLFYLYFGIMVLAKGFGLVSGEPLYKACMIIAILLIIARLAVGYYSRYEYAFVILTLILAFLIWRIAGNQAVIVGALLVVSLKNVSVKRVFQLGAILWSIAFTIQIILQLLNVVPRDFVIHDKLHLGYVIRWALGYSHPNVLQISYVVLISYVFYAVRMNVKKLTEAVLLSFAGACYIFLYSISITGMIYYLIFVGLLVTFEFLRVKGVPRGILERTVLQMVFPAAVGISVLGPLMLYGKAFDLVNRITTTRLYLSRYFLTNYGITAFGKDFSGLTAGLNLDCSYTNLLVYGGAVVFAFTCILYIGMINDTVREQRSWENSVKMAIIFSSVVAGISEPFLFNGSYKNLTLIFLGVWVYNKMSAYSKQTGCKCRSLMPVSKTVKVVVPDLEKLKMCRGISRSAWKIILTVCIICAVVGGSMYGRFAQMPQEVYALRISCDTDENSVNVFMSPEQIQQIRNGGDAWVLNYKDQNTPMLRFDGNIIKLEYLRGIVSSALWCAIVGGLITAAVEEKKKRDVHK